MSGPSSTSNSRQLVLPELQPLASCPGLQYWRPFFRTPYLVFVDESFRGFFELDPRGYFVHATVGIPESQYQEVKDETAPLFAEFRRLTTEGAAEFKHGEFKRLP